MSEAEMKKSLKEKIESLNESQLKEADKFLIRINNIPVGDWDLEEHVKNIIREREEVLKILPNDICHPGYAYPQNSNKKFGRSECD